MSVPLLGGGEEKEVIETIFLAGKRGKKKKKERPVEVRGFRPNRRNLVGGVEKKGENIRQCHAAILRGEEKKFVLKDLRIPKSEKGGEYRNPSSPS